MGSHYTFHLQLLVGLWRMWRMWMLHWTVNGEMTRWCSRLSKGTIVLLSTSHAQQLSWQAINAVKPNLQSDPPPSNDTRRLKQLPQHFTQHLTLYRKHLHAHEWSQWTAFWDTSEWGLDCQAYPKGGLNCQFLSKCGLNCQVIHRETLIIRYYPKGGLNCEFLSKGQC